MSEPKLDWDAQSLAFLTGIAFGWSQDNPEYTGEQDIYAGCRHCKFEMVKTWKSGQKEDNLEQELLREFVIEAQARKCMHIVDFLSYLQQRDRTERDLVALALLMEHVEKLDGNNR